MRTARFIIALALAVGLMLPAAAQACRVGSDEMFFTERPKTPEGADVIHVRFVNSGRLYQAMKDVPPPLPFARLFGVARLLDQRGGPPGWFPVYASPSSCSHHFAQPRDADGFLAGRIWRVHGEIQFEAAARYFDN